jgi:hypothetical protein
MGAGQKMAAEMSDLVIVGVGPDTAVVARAVGLHRGTADGPAGAIVVVSSRDDLDAVRDALRENAHRIVAIVAIRLEEDLVLAAYDLGLPVAFGYCTRAELDAAIRLAPDADGRRTAAALASIERTLETVARP